jgi:hypothetical protein
MLDMLADNLDELAVSASSAQLADTRQRTVDQLQQKTARLTVTALRVNDEGIEADLLVENMAGHKLPSGFPSRRTWLHVKVSDARGTVFFESGKPMADGRIEGNDADMMPTSCEPHYDVVSNTNHVQIYESVMNDTDGNITYTLLRGAAYRKDNRLLPSGFNPATAHPDIAVFGAAGTDADFIGGSDRITYQMNTEGMQGPFEISAELLHQTVAWSFVQDLTATATDAVNVFSNYYAAADKTPIRLASSTAILDPAQAYRITLLKPQNDGSIGLQIEGPAGGTNALDWSSNLVDWLRMTTIAQTNNPTWVSDPVSNALQRFYRLDEP